VWREYPEALDLQDVDLWECALLCPTGLLPGERGRMAASLVERGLVGGPGEVDREPGTAPHVGARRVHLVAALAVGHQGVIEAGKCWLWWYHCRSAFLAPPAPTTKPRPLLRRASFATSPTSSSTTPWPGDRPTEPSGRMNLVFPWGRAWSRHEPRSG
jgi:hypothetical protein